MRKMYKEISLNEFNLVLDEINEEIMFKKYMREELGEEKEELIEYLWKNQYDIMDGKIIM